MLKSGYYIHTYIYMCEDVWNIWDEVLRQLLIT